MTADIPELQRVTTGVPGLDTVLNGGLVQDGVYLVEGAPGSGKTILGNQICFHQAARGASTLYVTLLAESHTRMIAHLRQMTFFRPELVGSKVYYVSAFKVLESEGLDGLVKSMREIIASRKATFVVIDGLVSAEEFAPTARDFKKFIHEIQVISGMNGCTVLLLGSTERVRGIRPEHTMVDGLIELGDVPISVHSVRQLSVRKLRGAPQIRGRHSLEITNAGISIVPRIETLLGPPGDADVEQAMALAKLPPAEFGVAGLDKMLHGGLPRGSSTLVVGPSGSGKTVLGLQFLSAGALQGEPSLYFGFYERPSQVLAKCARLGIDLRGDHRKHLHLAWEPPVEPVVDALGTRLVRLVQEHGIRRVVFDGLHGLAATDYPDRLRAVFVSLSDELTRLGATSLFTIETRDLVGPRIAIPLEGVSALAENILLLRHVELLSQLHRLISIFKIRDRAYDGAIREFKITERGILVDDTFQSAELILTGAARIRDTEGED